MIMVQTEAYYEVSPKKHKYTKGYTSLSSADVIMSKSLGILFKIRSRTHPPTR